MPPGQRFMEPVKVPKEDWYFFNWFTDLAKWIAWAPRVRLFEIPFVLIWFGYMDPMPRFTLQDTTTSTSDQFHATSLTMKQHTFIRAAAMAVHYAKKKSLICTDTSLAMLDVLAHQTRLSWAVTGRLSIPATAMDARKCEHAGVVG